MSAAAPLQGGLDKLATAEAAVAALTERAAAQRARLAAAQGEVNAALLETEVAMEAASSRKAEVEVLSARQAAEQAAVLERKARSAPLPAPRLLACRCVPSATWRSRMRPQTDCARGPQKKKKTPHECGAAQARVEAELSEVQPLIDKAQRAVGNLKSEHLAEVRALKAPPAAVRSVREAVLRVLGQTDTSWNSMKRLLAGGGVKERILAFDAAAITPALRRGVLRVIEENSDAFDAARITRVSVAAAPLAEWVQVRRLFSHGAVFACVCTRASRDHLLRPPLLLCPCGTAVGIQTVE